MRHSSTSTTTGAVTFKSSPNFEKPLDAGGDTVHHIVVSASDGRSTTSQAVGITVTNVNEAATAITASGSARGDRNRHLRRQHRHGL